MWACTRVCFFISCCVEEHLLVIFEISTVISFIGYSTVIDLYSLVAQMVKASACNAGDPGLIPGLGRSPGEGNGNPLQYSCLENSMDGGAWWATVHRGRKE